MICDKQSLPFYQQIFLLHCGFSRAVFKQSSRLLLKKSRIYLDPGVSPCEYWCRAIARGSPGSHSGLPSSWCTPGHALPARRRGTAHSLPMAGQILTAVKKHEGLPPACFYFAISEESLGNIFPMGPGTGTAPQAVFCLQALIRKGESCMSCTL